MNTKRFTAVLLVGCFLLSVALATVGGVLLHRGNKLCVKFLEDWLLAISLLILAGSTSGIYCFVKGYKKLYLFCLLAKILLSLLLFALLVAFSLLVVGSHGEKWWTKKFLNYERWQNMENCFRENSVCRYHLGDGCCKQPPNCGFKEIASSPNLDCLRWDPNPGKLCFACLSCRAASVHRLRVDGRRFLAPFMVSTVLLLVLAFVLGYLHVKGSTVGTPPVSQPLPLPQIQEQQPQEQPQLAQQPPPEIGMIYLS
ncbi:Tetraspanin/Peripherin [Corchorus olitorius]|uniref:Tetraspanin/Peripherin n=1 Tax=Corchorus olitorius TaxID=93759 RepID=A0A1R3G917_9ROSI|nr:Tetraspanin/Peripherin [Corchorus olitorius]